jgi:O-antigen/teichoic acid export membrane protein
VIGAILTTTALTQYAIAAKIYAVVFTASVLMNSAVLSATSHWQALDDQARLQALFLRGTKYAVAISVPAAAAIFVLAPDLCRAWVGAEYESSGQTTRILIASIGVIALTGVGTIMLLGMNRLGPSLWLALGSAALNLAVTIPGAILWGVNGVVLGTTVAWLAVGVPCIAYLLHALRIPWLRFVRDVVATTTPWILVAGGLAYVGLVLIDPQALLPLLMLLGVAVGVASAGFLAFAVPAGERTSLLPRRG